MQVGVKDQLAQAVPLRAVSRKQISAADGAHQTVGGEHFSVGDGERRIVFRPVLREERDHSHGALPDGIQRDAVAVTGTQDGDRRAVAVDDLAVFRKRPAEEGVPCPSERIGGKCARRSEPERIGGHIPLPAAVAVEDRIGVGAPYGVQNDVLVRKCQRLTGGKFRVFGVGIGRPAEEGIAPPFGSCGGYGRRCVGAVGGVVRRSVRAAVARVDEGKPGAVRHQNDGVALNGKGIQPVFVGRKPLSVDIDLGTVTRHGKRDGLAEIVGTAQTGDGVALAEGHGDGVLCLLPYRPQHGIAVGHRHLLPRRILCRGGVFLPAPAQKHIAGARGHKVGQTDRLSRGGIQHPGGDGKRAAVCVIGKRRVVLPHGIKRHDRLPHREGIAGGIPCRRRIGLRGPAEEGIIPAVGDKTAQCDRLVPVRLRHCRSADAAVGVKADRIDGSFRPCGIENDRFALRTGNARAVVRVGIVHRPVLIVVEVPADKIVVVPGDPQTQGGRQTHRAEDHILDDPHILSPAVQFDVVADGRPVRIQCGVACDGIPGQGVAVGVEIRGPAAVAAGIVSVEVIPFACGGRQCGQCAVIGGGDRFRRTAALRVEGDRIGIGFPYGIERDGRTVRVGEVEHFGAVCEIGGRGVGILRPAEEGPADKLEMVGGKRSGLVVDVLCGGHAAAYRPARARRPVGVVNDPVGIGSPYRIQPDGVAGPGGEV